MLLCFKNAEVVKTSVMIRDNLLISFIISILIVSLVPNAVQSCTTFCLDHGGQPVFGRNYDWRVGDGLVFINKRGVTKTAWAWRSRSKETLLTWTSRYASATFNQFGREFPMGGINEAGLAVESMMLEETEYPAVDTRPAVESLQWIQYQLDNFSTIEEVIASDSNLRIRGEWGFGIHYLVCDRKNSCATIEFIGGKLISHTKDMMPVKTLSNSAYAASVSFWEKKKIPQSDPYGSIERFILAANSVRNYDPQKNTNTPIDFAFNLLRDVEHRSFTTQWSIVYDIATLSIYFRTRENPRIRYFSLKSFDFSCASPVQVLDVNAELWGDIRHKFVDYTYQINRDLVRDAYRGSFLVGLFPDHVIGMVARYPESAVCIE